MTTNLRARALLAIAAIGLAFANVNAQQSNTNLATAGQFYTDVDNYLSVTDFTTVNLKKGFGYIGYDSSAVALGYATKLGGIYLGAYYNGSILYNSAPTETTTVSSTALYNDIYTIVGNSKVTTTSWSNPTQNIYNIASALIGIGDMGFKVGVFQSVSARTDRFAATTAPSTALAGWNTLVTSGTGSQSDSVTEVTNSTGTVVSRGVTKYKDGYYESSTVSPGVQWGGLALKFGGMVLKPDVTASATFSKTVFKTEVETYSQAFGASNPTYSGVSDLSGTYTDTKQGSDQSSLGLTGKANFSLDFAPQGNATSNVSLSYQLTTRLYANPYYDENGSSATAAGYAGWWNQVTYVPAATQSTTTTLRAFELLERTASTHTITPSYKFGDKFGDKISYVVKAQLPVVLDLYTTKTSGKVKEVVTTDVFDGDPTSDTVQTTVKTYEGNSVNYFNLTLSPKLEAGMQYALTSVLTLNSGVTIMVPNYYVQNTTTTKSGFNTRTSTTVNGAGQTTASTYTSELGSARSENSAAASDWNALSATVSAGASWNLGEGLTLDARMSTTNFTVTASSLTVLLSILR